MNRVEPSNEWIEGWALEICLIREVKQLEEGEMEGGGVGVGVGDTVVKRRRSFSAWRLSLVKHLKIVSDPCQDSLAFAQTPPSPPDVWLDQRVADQLNLPPHHNLASPYPTMPLPATKRDSEREREKERERETDLVRIEDR